MLSLHVCLASRRLKRNWHPCILSSPQTINTELTSLLGIKYPVLLAGMNAVAHSELVAAVTNAGGMGTIGGLTMTPAFLRKVTPEIISYLPRVPVGSTAREDPRRTHGEIH